MIRKRPVTLILLLMLLWTFNAVSAQSSIIEPNADTTIDENALINWPPPIYTLRGEVELRGSANLADMTSYFIEYRALADTGLALDEDLPWYPAVLPASAPVLNDVLGAWDTEVTPDGLYELRLVINISGGDDPVIFRVSPVRVENDLPEFLITPTPFALPTSAALPTTVGMPTAVQEIPTLIPTPTAFSSDPVVTARISANVRAGDSTSYPTIGSLPEGEQAPIIGRSTGGTGWYNIRLSNGAIGWIAGSTVIISGDLSSVPFVAPPATPTPIATATPALPDLAIVGVRFDRGEIRQGENFQVIVRVRNHNGVTMPNTQLLCTVRPYADVRISANVGEVNGFDERDIVMPLRLDSGGGTDIKFECGVDVNREIAETNDDNNYFNLNTRLLAP